MIVGVCMMVDICVELIDNEGRGIMTEGGHPIPSMIIALAQSSVIPPFLCHIKFLY